jgi:cobalamin biosynthetic protein CobC
VLGQACLQDTEAHTRQRIRSDEASERLALLLERYGFKPQGGCALFQWLITEHAPALHEFMARRGILLRIFTHNSSLRFGLPANAAEEARLEQALQAFAKETQ